MKGIRVGYIMVMTALLSLTVAVGIAAFYPAPKLVERSKYPSLSTDYNSPQYQEDQKRYQEESALYDKKNEETRAQRKIWGQNIFAATLMLGAVLLVLSLILAKSQRVVSASFVYAAFIVVVFGAGLASYHAEGSVSSIFGVDTTTDLSRYKFGQFVILVTGSIVGLVLGFMGKLEEKHGGVL